MRPPKPPSERRSLPFNIRLTREEKIQFNAQAKIRHMELSSYLRTLAVEEGERLVNDGKLRRKLENETWEVFIMGAWQEM